MKAIRAMMVAAFLPAIALAHAGGRDIRGTIVKVDQAAVLVKRTDGVRESIPLTASTSYRVGSAAGHWEDMQAGSRIVVHIGHDGKAIEVHLPARK
jgi:hypothetical protein